MQKRFISLWFRHLITDWIVLRRPALKNTPFVLAALSHGRRMITAANTLAQAQGVDCGMSVADARLLIPSLEVLDDLPDLPDLQRKLLTALALWCIRYTPITAVDGTDGLILDVSGCAHLWGGERSYLKEIITRLRVAGYDVRGAMADTIGTAWAIARFGQVTPLIPGGEQEGALLPLPPASLRLEAAAIERLNKLGLTQIRDLTAIPRSALRRRFGPEFLLRMDQAFGKETETIIPIQPVEPYQERLPCLEPIRTATGIGIALNRLLDMLCARLRKDGKGLRTSIFKGYRMDGKLVQIAIGTNKPSNNTLHLFKLFELKISILEPDLGIELFVLEAPKVEEVAPMQETLWSGACGVEDIALSELLDRIVNKVGGQPLQRYLPDEHYWPERSLKTAASLQDKPATPWPDERPRPIHLLAIPEPVQVTAPIPDYPPMLFRYKGKLHKIIRADGPERIEQEWWMDDAQHRDYYSVEDEQGVRYWLFRSGHYTGDQSSRWFIHGFFA